MIIGDNPFQNMIFHQSIGQEFFKRILYQHDEIFMSKRKKTKKTSLIDKISLIFFDSSRFLYYDEERRKRHRYRIRKRQELVVNVDQGETPSSPWQKTIFGSIAVRYQPQRWLNLSALYRAARLNDFFIVDGGFQSAHARHSYFSSLVQRVFRCYRDIERFHSPSYILITDLADNIQTSDHILPQEQSVYFHSTRQNYLDLFDKNSLVYLTPDSPNEMTHYDHNAVYILGGIYDDQNKEPLTYEKALRQNIRHVRLPLEKYLTFVFIDNDK